MKGFAKIMLIVLLATPAYAQVPNVNMLGDVGKIKTQEEVDAEAARDDPIVDVGDDCNERAACDPRARKIIPSQYHHGGTK